MTYPHPPPAPKPPPVPNCPPAPICGKYERGRYACHECWLVATGAADD